MSLLDKEENAQQEENRKSSPWLQNQPKKQRPPLLHKFKKLASEQGSKAIVFCLRSLNRLDKWITIQAYNPNPSHYEDLTPSGDIEEETTYFKALQWALRNKEINNIALTGPYGSGKSSILKSFQASHKEYFCLNISLATFNDKAETDNEERKLVELSILQQLFYQVEDRHIPDSRFKRIKRLTRFQQFLLTIAALLWLIALVFILLPAFFDRLSWWRAFYAANNDRIIYVVLSIFVLGIALFIFSFARIFRNTRLNKLNITSGEMEIGKDEQKSILNKYLDEILYFFEATDYDVVVIEDLDRFNDPEIFTKLREINTLINNSGQINRRVVFIYAIKDDMFKDKSRAKFFDFIIPVIPVINSSNSIEILRKKLTSSKLSESISEEFISDITLYIDDMRMLKNVVNEYAIYRDKIGSKLNQDKLLGMIIYKNLYPRDFAELHINQGLVAGVFARKAAFIKETAAKIQDQINELEKEVEKLESLNLRDLAELRAVYIAAILEEIPQGTLVYDGHNSITIKQLKEDKHFDRLVNQAKIHYYQYGVNSTGTTFKALQAKIDPEQTYEERAAEIKRKTESGINEHKKELDRLKAELATVQHWSLSEVLQYRSSDVLDEQIGREKLLVYLLRYGYIDEMYHAYISYFYEGSLTKEDMDFVLSVKNGEALGFDFRLTQVGQILKKLRPAEFHHREVLNYSLVDYLIESKPQYNEAIEAIVGQLAQKSKTTTAFLEGYRQEGEHPGDLIACMAAGWEDFWEYIIGEPGFSDQTKKEYLILLIKHASLDALTKLNGNGALAVFIAKKEDFLSLITDPAYTDKIKKLIARLNIKFECLFIPEGAQSLFDYIYVTSSYKLNPYMLELVVRRKSGKDEKFLATLPFAHYTTILQSSCTHLINYIATEIETYITDVFLPMETNTGESEEIIISLLNNEQLSLELKEQIIQKEAAKISEINAIAKDNWSVLLEASKLKPTWQNVSQYLQEVQEPDDAMVSFLNREENYIPLAEVTVDQEIDDKEEADKLQERLLLCAELSDRAYEQLVNSNINTYPSLDIGGLSPAKVDALIRTKTLALTLENYKALKEQFSNKIIAFLEVNADKFIKNWESYSLAEDEIARLLTSPAFTPDQKDFIVQHIDDGIITTQNLANNIGHLAFLSRSIKLKAVILDKLFTLLSATRKIKLLTTQIHHLSAEDITRYLQAIGGAYALLTTSANPEIEADEMNVDLVQALESKNYISSFKPTDQGMMRIFTKKR